MRLLKRFVYFFLLLLSFTACRYDEGPFLSFYSPTQRLVNTWSLQKAFCNGEQISNSDDLALQLGTFYAFHAYGPLVVTTYYNDMMRESYSGSWKFIENDKKLKIQFQLIDNSYNYTANIKKLSRTDLIYEYSDNNGNNWRLVLYAQSY